MSPPHLLPIKRLEDLHTEMIGTCEQGQFMIIETLPIRAPEALIQNSQIYLVRFLFRPSGELIDVKHATMPGDSSDDDLRDVKKRLLHELNPFTFCDIVVRLFHTTIGDVTFGLVYDPNTETVNLAPGPIITFMAPWDGEYFT